LKRRPPANRDPLPEEIEAYKPYLAEQIKIIKPKIIVTLGRFSLNYFLPFAKISRDQGKIFRLNEELFIVPFFHPAAALRSPKTLEALQKSFYNLPKIVEKCEELVKSKNFPSLLETNPTTANNNGFCQNEIKAPFKQGSIF